jgi:SAM-dependent methyltransferase
MAVLKAITSRLVQNPWVYDMVQTANGARITNKFLIRQFSRVPANARVLEIGGGTGRIKDLWPTPCRYICTDFDPRKLRRFREKHPDGMATVADGGRLPIKDDTIDAVVMVAVSHHLPDDVFQRALREASRVLRKDGLLIFYDQVWIKNRYAGRLLWRYDEGSFPRVPKSLDAFIRRDFDIVHRDRIAFLHQYALWIGTPKETAPGR